MRYTEFTNLYSLQKTLRFELIPIGNTGQKIEELQEGEENTLLGRDTDRATHYKKAKKMLDAYHRFHIEAALPMVDFEKLDLKKDLEFIQKSLSNREEFASTEEKEKALAALTKAQANLRKEIVAILKGSVGKKTQEKYSKKEVSSIEAIKERYAFFGKKELFDPEKNSEFRNVAVEADFTPGEFEEAISSFKGFTTYFKGFHENRENMYSEEAEGTAIANRCINENLPKFLNNIRVFEKIKTELSKEFKQVEKDLCDGKKLASIFQLDGYQNHLNQKGIEFYNLILGGKFNKDTKEKVQGLNEKINLYNQSHPEERLPFLKPLYKQILAKTNSDSFRPEPFESDVELLGAIEDFWEKHIQKPEYPAGTIFPVLKNFQKISKKIASMKNEELSGIFVDAKRLSALSHQAFGDWGLLKTALRTKYDSDNSTLSESARERGANSFFARDYFTLLELEEALDFYFKNVKTHEETRSDRTSLKAFFSEIKFVETLSHQVKGEIQTEELEKDLVEVIEESYRSIEPILQEKGGDTLHQDKGKGGRVEKIKQFLDSLKTLQRHLAYLHVEGDASETNGDFYYVWDGCYEALQPLTQLYNKVRNRLTRKPSSEEKMKLNFDSTTLLDGWDISKETANLSVILEKEGLYYLAIMDKKHNRLFKDIPEHKEKGRYRKINYKQISNPSRDLPHKIFSATGVNSFNPSQKILDVYNNGTFKQGDSFSLKDLYLLIDFYKEAIAQNNDWEVFQFQFKPTKEYGNISEFYSEVESQGYKIWFTNVNADLIDSWVSEGKLYLFKIYNKDFSSYSKGKPNLHTIYWKNVFDPANLKDVVFKLNGEAEIFFRPATIKYSDEERKKGHHAKELKGKFDYPILKDRRYSLNKYQFHVPITLNFHSQKDEYVNLRVLDFIKSSKQINAIGIDRGERHLLYLSLIDAKGKIIYQDTLNTVKNEAAKTEIDYHEKLDQKEKERKAARENWDVIENIKELKEGYLSQVVHRIAELMVEHQAILIMEDLNFGFKRGRFKVEKQVYQKFEKMLIDKLNYLVFKGNKPTEPGGSLNAYQLTSKFESFQKLGKQTGMIFYVPASYTSKVDPVTGFYDFLKPKATTISNNQNFFQKFDSIRFNAEKGYFEFHATYGKFNQAVNPEGKSRKKGKTDDALLTELAGQTWTICSHEAERFRIRRTKNGSVSYSMVDCNQEFKDHLQKAKISFEDGTELRDAIAASKDTTFLKGMIDTLRTLVALRYNNGKRGADEKDYILSPVADSRGQFFNSLESDGTLPKDADANGAYHIAKKGLLLVDKIKEFDSDGKKKYPDLSLSNHEWFYSLWKE